jgi:hypothetical protein
VTPGNTGAGRPDPLYRLHITDGPPIRSILTITSEFKIEYRKSPPNRWWRFWYWALLGWRWEKVG